MQLPICHHCTTILPPLIKHMTGPMALLVTRSLLHSLHMAKSKPPSKCVSGMQTFPFFASNSKVLHTAQRRTRIKLRNRHFCQNTQVAPTCTLLEGHHSMLSKLQVWPWSTCQFVVKGNFEMPKNVRSMSHLLAVTTAAGVVQWWGFVVQAK